MVPAPLKSACAAALLAALLAACDRTPSALPPGAPGVPAAGVSSTPADLTRPEPTLSVAQIVARPDLVHSRLKQKNPYYQGEARVAEEAGAGLIVEIVEAAVTDLSPLKGLPIGGLDLRSTPVADLTPLTGMPLTLLALEQTRVSDLAPLKGMKLAKLYLNQTSVRDLSPLAGMPLIELMAVGAKVEDLSPLATAPLTGLWLNDNPVTNVAALARCPLVTLTLEGTRVADLGPLAGVRTLQRLHIGGTPVQDLSPLAGLPLTRLIFNPERITNGLEAIRAMSTLTELGTTLEGRMPPAEFWRQLK